MPPPDIEEMLARDRAEWAPLVAALDARPEEVLHDPESPAWTAKEVYAHLARWMEHSTADFEAYIEGKRAMGRGGCRAHVPGGASASARGVRATDADDRGVAGRAVG